MRKGNGKSVARSDGKSGKARNGLGVRETGVREAGARESWNDQVTHLIQHDGLSREKARDQVIMSELASGHADALAMLLIEGHVPSPSVRFALALMLLENDAAEAAIDRHHADHASLWLAHRLVIKPRPAEPRHARPEGKASGEVAAARKPGPVMHELGYEAAIARLDQAVLAAEPTAAPTAPKPARQPPAQAKRRK